MGICDVRDNSSGKSYTFPQKSFKPNLEAQAQTSDSTKDSTSPQVGVPGDLIDLDKIPQQNKTGVEANKNYPIGGSNQNHQQQQIGNLINDNTPGSNDNITADKKPSKAEIIAKILRNGIENKEALGHYI